tara:strand:+ start:406 stop:927 length:522 start_codon:yes stop_codon:yes gene_type:complete
MLDLSNYKIVSNEVYYLKNKPTNLNKADIKKLIDLANKNQSKKIRLCFHDSINSNVHEMLIVHSKSTYVKPHKHLNKEETMMILEGNADYIIFDNTGKVKKIIEMGNYESGKSFYQIIPKQTFHMIVIKSDWLVFKEVTQGPFNAKDTVFAPWRPDDKNIQLINEYIKKIKVK